MKSMECSDTQTKEWQREIEMERQDKNGEEIKDINAITYNPFFQHTLITIIAENTP